MKGSYIINLFGGPGAGKSTCAAGIFYNLKMKNLNVELVTEFAKDLVYEKRDNFLKNYQYLIFAEQNRRIQRLIENDIDFIISDSPLLLSSYYYPNNDIKEKRLFINLLKYINIKYNNINFFLKRNLEKEYNCKGRIHNEIEANKIDEEIQNILKINNEKYYEIQVNHNICVDECLKIIYKNCKNCKNLI